MADPQMIRVAATHEDGETVEILTTGSFTLPRPGVWHISIQPIEPEEPMVSGGDGWDADEYGSTTTGGA